jgi:hypothetical protein
MPACQHYILPTVLTGLGFCGAPRRSALSSAARSPVALHSGDSFFFAHSCHLSFAKADSREEQVDEIGR